LEHISAAGGRAQASKTRITVRSAVLLDDEQRAAIQALCRERCPDAGELVFEVDPAVLGGIWLRLGDIVIDGSLAGKIEQLGHYLREQLRVTARREQQVSA